MFTTVNIRNIIEVGYISTVFIIEIYRCKTDNSLQNSRIATTDLAISFSGCITFVENHSQS